MAFKFGHIPEQTIEESSDLDTQGMDPNIIIKANSSDFILSAHLLKQLQFTQNMNASQLRCDVYSKHLLNFGLLKMNIDNKYKDYKEALNKF